MERRRVKVRFNYNLYETIKDCIHVEVYDWSCREIIILSKEQDLIRAKFKPVTWAYRPEGEHLHTPGMLFMYVPETLLEIYSDLERIL